MSDLERRSGSSPTPRRRREQRAYNLVLVGGLSGLVFVVTAILALVTSFSWTIPILAAVLAVICALVFRRTVR